MEKTNESVRVQTVNSIFSLLLGILMILTAVVLAVYVHLGGEARFFIGPFNGEVLILELLLQLEGFMLLRL